MTTQMTYTEYMSFRSEIYTLQRLLNGLTPARHLERYGLEDRLERIQAKLEGVPVPPRPKKLAVSFNGEPAISTTTASTPTSARKPSPSSATTSD